MSEPGTLSRRQIHDLMSPLSTIRGFAELMLVRPSEPEATRRYLELIVAGAKELEGALRALGEEKSEAA